MAVISSWLHDHLETSPLWFMFDVVHIGPVVAELLFRFAIVVVVVAAAKPVVVIVVVVNINNIQVYTPSSLKQYIFTDNPHIHTTHLRP